jgi:membrane protein implicated in regulation of membrane protease activity
MSSLELDNSTEPRSRVGTLYRLLDPAFGHFVWAAHFLAVYIGTAVSCVLRLGATGTGTWSGFQTALVLLTIAALAVVVLHAIRRHRQYREDPDRSFRMAITIGNDGIAVVGIVWQLFPIFLVPVCA